MWIDANDLVDTANDQIDDGLHSEPIDGNTNIQPDDASSRFPIGETGDDPDVDDEDLYMKQNPELYGLRRSVRPPTFLHYSHH